jgi:hypothetical protein
MDAVHTIRQSLSQVAALRAQVRASGTLQNALLAVKQFQARRFAGTYQDLLHSSSFAGPTRFFLEELYGSRDFSDRDSQFARIAGALQTFFPSQVVATAVALAQLHALTERLDVEMAQQCVMAHAGVVRQELSSMEYVTAWRMVATPATRVGQLQSVLNIGQELDRLTRTKGLRLTLRMMRGPAKAGGLHSLQSFLEAGFDTFASMGGKGRDAQSFLETIRVREGAWIDALFHAPRKSCEMELENCLGKAQ